MSIKPAEKMHLMRADMSGAAAVLGAMHVVGAFKPEIKVTAIVVAAENTPDGNAYRPGDILVYRNGKSVHVDNTDAEGRLILADGLIQAGLLGATHIVDIATLTGAAARALGNSFSALMGNNRTLVNAVTRAGGNHGEAYWKLPLPAEYKELLKCAFADINNVGGPAAGAITAGLFLQEFVPAGASWAHLDIAPTFWREKPWKYFGEGPTGVGARTLADLAINWKANTAK
jgi:leucyl aminopeptidase